MLNSDTQKLYNSPLVLKAGLMGITLAFLFTLSPKIATGADLIKIDGSSTVYPITEAVAEEFQIKNRSSRVTVGISGSGGGFKKFCRGETDITDASRPIKTKEIKLCGENGIQYIEIPVAYDGLAVVVNPKNDWVKQMTISDLKKIWEPDAQGKVTHWNQIYPHWPKKEIHLFGPGVDSGTFDYFTEAIMGKSQSSRGDFTSSEDDNILVQGIANDVYALGYFGLAYYEENKSKLKLVPIDGGNGPIASSHKTVEDGSYYLARPLFIYVSESSLKKPEVKKFVDFYLQEGPALAEEVGYISLPQSIRKMVDSRVKERRLGSVYEGKGSVGKSLNSLLRESN
ncbi:MAG TPA: PstS family phosphate ABC transporter substrate-binding protein [Nitrospiria bacterium]|jgi:phosphate transport system substrate-binding protein